MDLLKYSILNSSDIKDLLTSFDKAIKIRLDKEGFLESRYVPKMLLGENKDYVDQDVQVPYERPFITFNLNRRGPASLSDSNFFVGTLQHSSNFKRIIDEDAGISEEVLYRDNEIKLVVRAKTKQEIYFLLQMLERVVVFESKYINCELIRFIESSDLIKSQFDMHIANFIFRARTKVIVRINDDAIMNNVNIIYKNTMCRFYNIVEQKCDYKDLFGSLPTCQDYDPNVIPPVCRPIDSNSDAQRVDEANDIFCYRGKEWCTEHENTTRLVVKG